MQPQSVGPVPAPKTTAPAPAPVKKGKGTSKPKASKPALDPYEEYLKQNPIPLPQGVQTQDEAFYDYLKANGL